MGVSRHALNARNAVRMPINQHRFSAPETQNPWFWNPGRFDVQREPSWFRELLDREGHTDIACVWNPNRERWQVFAKTHRVQTEVCHGWRLLFPVQYRDGSYAPLDERTIAKIYLIDAHRMGEGVKYFDRIAAEMARDKARAEAADDAETVASAGEYFDYTLPKVGYGPISSSKVVGQ